METLTHVMAVGANCWGKGNSTIEALNNWQKNFGRLRYDKITIHLRAVSADGYVDEMGTLFAKRCEQLPDLTISKKDFEAIWAGTEILMDLINDAAISDAVYDLKESDIDD
jgi:hypothetical protein